MMNELNNISTLVFDVDGVMTDGGVYMMANGEAVRRMNIKDGYALQLAKKRGYHMAIISGGSSEAVPKRFQALGIHDVYMKASDKADVLDEFITGYGVDIANVLYMGDDIPDYEVMEKVAFACCPADAATEIQSIAQYVSPIGGGQGCVRDIIEKVMKAQGKWFEADLAEEEKFKW